MEFSYALLTTDSSGKPANLIAWDLSSGTQLCSFTNGVSHPRTLNILDKHYYIVSAQHSKAFLRFWSTNRTNQLQKQIALPGKVNCLTVSGTFVLAGIEDAIYVWEFTTGACHGVLRRHVQNVSVLKSTTKGFVSGGDDGQVMLWNLADVFEFGSNAQPVEIWHNHGDVVTDLHFAPVLGIVISVSSDGTCCCYAPGRQPDVRNVDGEAKAVTTNASENRIFVGLAKGPIVQLDLVSSKQPSKLPDLVGHTASVNCLSACPLDDNCLVSGSEDKTARVWDVTSRHCIHVLKHSGRVDCILVIPRYLLIGTDDSRDFSKELIPISQFAKFTDENGAQGEPKKHLVRKGFEVASKAPAVFEATAVNRGAEAEQKLDRLIAVNHQIFDYAMRQVLTSSK